MANTTWDVAKKGTSVTLSNNNQTASVPNTSSSVLGTNGYSAGKRYFEMHVDSGTVALIGIGNASTPLNGVSYTSSYIRSYYEMNGNYYPTGANGAGYAAGDIIGVAVDLDAGSLSFYKNGTSQGVAFTTVAALGTVYPFLTTGSSIGYPTVTLRTNQFSYLPPIGYSAWDGGSATTITQPQSQAIGGF
jgi:hypothetical protein